MYQLFSLFSFSCQWCSDNTEIRAFQMLQAESITLCFYQVWICLWFLQNGRRRMTCCFHLSHCMRECKKELSHQQLSITALSWGHSHLPPIKDNSRLCLQCGVFPSPFFLGVMYNLVKELNILQVVTRNREVSGTESFHTDFIISFRFWGDFYNNFMTCRSS